MLPDLLIVVGGALLILVLAEIVLRETLALMAHYRVSASFVGLTVLSIGTSLLEIVTHVIGSVQILHAPESMDTLSGLLIGSNIGSDILQQNFVLPLAGLIGSVVVVRRLLVVEVGGLIAASCLLWLACAGGAVTRVEGLLLVLAYAGYLTYVARTGAHTGRVAHARRLGRPRRYRAMAVVALAFAAMAWVADPVLLAATRLVARLPLSASFFGVIVLGVAATLPELMTALVSIARGQRDISAGILIGSNITNPLLGVGLGALISGYTAPTVTVYYDLPVKVATGVLLYFFLRRRNGLGRPEAVALILAYVAYVALRPLLFPEDLPQ